MNDYVISLIRTWVPFAVGALLAWLISLGVELDPSIEPALAGALVGVLSGVYYAAIRFLEDRWPWFGYLLGVKKAPSY